MRLPKALIRTSIAWIDLYNIIVSNYVNNPPLPVWDRHMGTTGVGVTKAPFVNFSVSKSFDPVKVPVRLFASHSYLTGVITAQLRQQLSNMNVINNS